MNEVNDLNAPRSAVTAPKPPPPTTRIDFILVRLDRFFARCDGFMNRWLPEEYNPIARSGAAANLALLITVASGILMLIWYRSSVQFAYSSIEGLSDHSLGGWARSLHRYSSDLTMLFLFIHAGRTFVARKFTGSRWLPWVSGIMMCALIWFIGWTGYWLIWDQPAQQIAMSTMRLVDLLPIFGEPMSRLFVVDRLVPSLLFFVVFFTHMLLPLGIAVGLAIHLMRVTRARLLPNRIVSFSIIGGIALAAFVIPAPLDQEARMNEKVEVFTVDAWYMSPLALGLRFQQTGLWFALFGGVALSAGVPWILGRRRVPASYQAVVTQSRCHSCNQCSEDCPFDAISMIPRTDGKAFDTQALVDPLKCVGCGVCAGSCDSEGIGLQWFDTMVEEKRISSSFSKGLEPGAPPWIAFVCSDIVGGLPFYDESKWTSRLPGYQLFAIPNSSWLAPKLVERLLTLGAEGVLVVRDSRHEANARDGRLAIGERLLGLRGPAFRPGRAPSESWRVFDYLPGQEAELTQAASGFQGDPSPRILKRTYKKPSMILGSTAIVLLLCVAAILPSSIKVSNPSYMGPEFVFSFKALGDWSETLEVAPGSQDDLPIHMRGRSLVKQSRSPVNITLNIDGVGNERVFLAKGISNDGPALDQWRERFDAGIHKVSIELDMGEKSENLIWKGSINAEDGRIYVVSFDPLVGFIEEE